MSEDENVENQDPDMPSDDKEQEPEVKDESKTRNQDDVDIIITVKSCDVELQIQWYDGDLEYFVNDHVVSIDEYDMVLETVKLKRLRA